LRVAADVSPEPLNTAAGDTPVPQAVTAASVAVPDVSVPVPDEGSTQFDERRARQLLDRAFSQAERGELGAAILSCRQSVALDPDAPQGFSMLGLLLERSGDLANAAQAYQKVLQLQPDSRLEAESLQRIEAALARRKGQQNFHFDDKDLFGDTGGTAAATGGAAATAIPSTPADSSVDALRSAFPANSQLTPATPTPSVSALDFGLPPVAPTSMWQRLVQRPSFYFRGAPLVATTALGLAFMLWSREAVISQQTQQSVIVPGGVPSVIDPAANINSAQPNSAAPATNPAAPNANDAATAAANEGMPTIPVQNRPAPKAPAGAQNPGVNAAANVGGSGSEPSRPSANAGQPRIPSPRVNSPRPSQPRNILPPSNPYALPPARPVLPRSGSSNDDIVLPPPSAADRSGAAPDNGASSSGGGPVNTTGAGMRGYIRLQPPRPGAAVRPSSSTRATNAERAAIEDIRAGREERAIDNITTAIEADGDTGWRYQQRALLFLDRGDNQRAADDFQTAINAYRDQIRRGERVSEARAGIKACQSGLRLAMSNSRR
jgi:Tfp pilus assembly protein PilF